MADETKRGQPTKYDEKYCKQVYQLSLLGLTLPEIANVFDVHVDTICEWKNVHPDFSEAIKKGKEQADSKVVMSLYKRACGFKIVETEDIMYKGEKHTLTRTKEVPPETMACIYWLNNRQRAKWSNRQVIEVDENYTAPEPRQITFLPAKTA